MFASATPAGRPAKASCSVSPNAPIGVSIGRSSVSIFRLSASARASSMLPRLE
jgi:hypothetical protein